MDRYESLIENSTGKTPSSRGLSMGSESLVRQSVDTAIRLISANDETRWSIAVSGDKALKREELRPVDTALRAPAARLPSEGPMHGHPRANDTGTRLATDAYDRIAQLVLGRARREGELFDVPAALERPMARLLLDTAELRSRYRAAVDTVLDVIRDGRLAELVDTLRKFGRVSMPDDGRILAHGRASGHEIGDEWWEDDIRDESPRTPLAEHYEHRLRQLIGMIPEIWAGIFLGMGITSENHGPDLVGLSEDGKPLHVEVKTGGRSIALPLRQAERFARIPHAYYLLVFHGEESPWALYRQALDGADEAGGWEDSFESAAVRLATSMMGETRMFLVPARMVSEFYRDLDVKERNGDQHGGIYGLWKPVSRARCEELAARGKSRTLRMVTDTDPGKTCSFTIVGGRSTEDRFFRKTGRAKAIPDTGAAKSARPGRRRSPTITETPDPNIPF